MRHFTIIAALFLIAGCKEASPEEALGANASDDPTATGVKVGNGPFGLAMGMPISEVDGAKKQDQPGIYLVDSPPKPHPDFEQIVLIAYPQTGICLIRGIGRSLPNDGNGSSIRSKVDALAGALETKYGKPELHDLCGAGDIACDPQFWMMTLLQGERGYAYGWEKQSPAMNAAKIESIYVAAKADDISTSYPILEFASADSKRCEAAENAASAEVL